VITGLYLHAPEVTPEILRAVSISRLEAQLNAGPRVEPGQPVTGLTWPVIADVTRSISDDEPEPSLAELRERAREQTRQARPKEPDRPRLTRPGGASPEEFYPRVAAAYAEYAPRTRAPAKEIATEAGVPVTTAHRWIREARRRGFLTPARKGKAG
jgi:DNA-directed RNA polymerase specialized sigma24 family protein